MHGLFVRLATKRQTDLSLTRRSVLLRLCRSKDHAALQYNPGHLLKNLARFEDICQILSIIM
ncbi:hypothetical protein C7G42_01155 [Bradyrhizobium sp. MOS003]|jgi:hypothetical protein|nr:hypothetical protein C7G42_01155 [Bradyrhizobium sp. MOS003]